MKAFHKVAALFLILTGSSLAQAEPKRSCAILLAGQTLEIPRELALAVQALNLEHEEDLVAIERSSKEVALTLEEIKEFKSQMTWFEKRFSERWVRLWGGDTTKLQELEKLNHRLENLKTLLDINIRGAAYNEFWVRTAIENWLRSQSQKWVKIRQLERALKAAVCLADQCLKEAARIDGHIGFAAHNFQWRLRGKSARKMFQVYQNRSPMDDLRNLVPQLIHLNKLLIALDVEWPEMKPRDLKAMTKHLTLTQTAENVIHIRKQVAAMRAQLIVEQQEVDNYIESIVCATTEQCLKFKD